MFSKKSFAKAGDWWRPLRTRQPKHLLVPKIVTPHLSIVPKFSLDRSGEYAVSRSPFLIPKITDADEEELLLFFLAVLNSTPCYWYISNHSHKYSSGYTMIEVNTLEQTPVPDPSLVSVQLFKKLIALVRKRLKMSNELVFQTDLEIDKIVCEMYNLNQDEVNLLSIE